MRAANKAKRDSRHMTQTPTRTALAAAAAVAVRHQPAPSEGTDNAFNRFTSTGKTRAFGNALAISNKVVTSQKNAELTKQNSTASRNKFNATKSPEAVPAKNVNRVKTKTEILTPKSTASSMTISHTVREENSLSSQEESSSIEVIPPVGGGCGSSSVTANIALSSRQKQKRISGSDFLMGTSSTRGTNSPGGKGGSKVNVRALLSGNRANPKINSSRPDSVHVSDRSEHNDGNRSKHAISTSSPRHDSNKDRSSYTPQPSDSSSAPPRKDAEETTPPSGVHRQHGTSSASEMVMLHGLNKSAPPSLKEASSVVDSGGGGRISSGLEDSNKQSTSNSHAVSSDSTLDPLTFTDSSSHPHTKNTQSLQGRGSVEDKQALAMMSAPVRASASAVQYTATTITGAGSLTHTPSSSLSSSLSPVAQPLTVEKEEEEKDEAASAAAIELRNARRRFRLSRDAAAAAADSRKATAGRRREVSFITSSNRRSSDSSGGRNDTAPGSPGKRDGVLRKSVSSPIRSVPHTHNLGSGGTVKNHAATSSQAPLTSLSTSNLPTNRVENLKSCLRKNNAVADVQSITSELKNRRVHFQDDDEHRAQQTAKLQYANIMKPRVVIRSRPPLTPSTMAAMPAPRTVEEALVFSKLKAENLQHHQDVKMSPSRGLSASASGSSFTPSRAGDASPPLKDSARSDVTMSLSRDEYFDKEDFVF